MKKHAYLIIAHNEFNTLIHLLKELDDLRNDIYIHIDKKAGRVDVNALKKAVQYSGIYFVPRMKVFWGTISQVKCELRLLKEAINGNYHYYHLISGVDFPLKSQDYIHDLLEEDNKEYLSYFKEGDEGKAFLYKLKIYYPLLRFVGKGDFVGNGLRDRLGRKLGYWQSLLNDFQESHNFDRIKKYRNVVFYKGDQWFTITHDFASYVIENKNRILKTYYLTNGPDEIFMQTLALNSKYAARVNNNSLRHIDWLRGNPYEYRMTDLDELKSSDKLFVRKISCSTDPELVEALSKYIHESNK